MKKKEMWAVQHVPSGNWDSGDSVLTLYPFKHTAQRECPNDVFTPIKVVVMGPTKMGKD